MNLEQRYTVPASRARLWDFLMDVPAVTRCVPGVESMTPRSDDEFEGHLRLKVGPISLRFEGVVTVVGRDQANWQAALKAEAKDRKVGGGVHATSRLTLQEKASQETEILIQTELRFLGKIGEFGQPVIRRKADEVTAQFVRNLTTALEART